MSVEGHLNYPWTLLRLFSRAGESLKLKKWSFFGALIDYLSHEVPNGRLEILKNIDQCYLQTKTLYKHDWTQVMPRFLQRTYTVCTELCMHSSNMKEQAGKGSTFPFWMTEQDWNRADRNPTTLTDDTANTITTEIKPTTLAWYRCWWQTSDLPIITEGASRTSKARVALGTIA